MVLPTSPQTRCVGATWHRGMERCRFDLMTREEQVLDDVVRRRPRNCSQSMTTRLAGAGWERPFVATEAVAGLCHPTALRRLTEYLRRFTAD